MAKLCLEEARAKTKGEKLCDKMQSNGESDLV